jgi:hypothetical protein
VLADGTRMTITGDQVEGDGKVWYPVTTDDNQPGYVQIEYVVRTEPRETAPAPTGEPK